MPGIRSGQLAFLIIPSGSAPPKTSAVFPFLFEFDFRVAPTLSCVFPAMASFLNTDLSLFLPPPNVVPLIPSLHQPPPHAPYPLRTHLPARSYTDTCLSHPLGENRPLPRSSSLGPFFPLFFSVYSTATLPVTGKEPYWCPGLYYRLPLLFLTLRLCFWVFWPFEILEPTSPLPTRVFWLSGCHPPVLSVMPL